MATRRFPWALLFAAWLVIGAGLTFAFRHLVLSGNFPDTDDYMRLQQVRDLIAGQGWFDITQHRVSPPGGLPMHWSRLVDIPLLLFAVPLTPLLGAHMAETVALVGAPLLTLFVLLLAVTAIVRALLGDNPRLALMGWLFAILPPLVLAQIHPGRIDHHGWQIALAASVFAALLDKRPERSGVLAGLLTALFLAISIEGAPFALAALAAVALLWAFGQETGVRLSCFVQSLAVCSIVANLLLAPTSRWTGTQCDAVTTGHLVALVAAATTLTLAVRFADARGAVVRFAALAVSGAVAIVALYAVAPSCLGNPFGTMNPLVQAMWFENVEEGQPVWRQDVMGAVAALAFPLIGIIGTLVAVRGAASDKYRPWLLTAILGILTLLTGAMVFRASAIAQVIAIPGALVLVEAAVAWSGRRQLMLARVLSHTGVVILLSPMGPTIVAATLVPVKPPVSTHIAAPVICNIDCAAARLNVFPATMLMNEIDLGPVLIARSHHNVYVASYHRLQGPLADTITFFLGNSADAQAFMRAHQLRYIVIAPAADETAVYIRKSPSGMAAQLASGKIPAWLRLVDYGGGKSLLLFEAVQP